MSIKWTEKIERGKITVGVGSIGPHQLRTCRTGTWDRLSECQHEPEENKWKERKKEWMRLNEWMLKASKEENKRKKDNKERKKETKENKWRKRHGDEYCDDQREEKYTMLRTLKKQLGIRKYWNCMEKSH